MSEDGERAEVLAAIRKGAFNRPFSRCSFCKAEWNGGQGHDHAEERRDAEADGDFVFIHEERGGTIGFDYEQAADAVLALVATRERELKAENARLKEDIRIMEQREDERRGAW